MGPGVCRDDAGRAPRIPPLSSPGSTGDLVSHRRASWFETALTRLLTMRVLHPATSNDLILRSRASGVSKDGPDHDSRHEASFSRHEMSELLETHHPRNHRGCRECRMREAPVAACAVKKHRRQQLQVRRINRHSLRNGFNGFLRALPGDRALLPPSCADRSAHLAPASGRQNHTTSPSAQTPLVAQTNCARRCASIASRSQRP
jgi:hypothetical protein